MKRFIALVLSLVMALSLCAPAYAEGEAVTVKNAEELANAVANGATNIVLADGVYENITGCAGKTLTLSGSQNAVLMVKNEGEDGCDYDFGGGGSGVGNITFNGVTINTTKNTGNYKGYAYMKGTFNGCNFVGAYSLNNANDFEFNDCTFDFENGYFWTWGANSVTFNRCVFNGNSKNILAHGWASTVITINDCAFAAAEKGYASGGTVWTAAVEIDPAGTNVYTINFTGNNTINENYAGWTRLKDDSTGHTFNYAVTFVSNFGNSISYDYVVAAGSTLPEFSFAAPEGHTFKGWATTKDATEVLDAATYTVTAPTTLYAIWEEITYTVSFDANGGTKTMAPVAVPAGDYTLPECGFTAPEGKIFKAWSVDGVEYAADEEITVAADVKVTAVWMNAPVQVEDDVMVQVTDPVMIPNPELTVEQQAVAEEVEVSEICTEAMTEVVEDVAKVEVSETVIEEKAAELDALIPEDVSAEDIVVVVQTNFEVKVEAVSVEGDKTTVTLDITPVYQKVVTTETIANSGAKIEAGENAVVAEKGELDLKGQEVEITIAIPDVLVTSAASNGNKLYVTHTKDDAVKTSFVYVATVDPIAKTATFTNPNGFSSFTIETTDNTVATVDGDRYTKLDHALKNVADGGTVTVLSGNHTVTVDREITFKLDIADNATVEIKAADGYTVSEWNGTYTVREVYNGWGGGYYVPTTPDADDEEIIESPETFDAGVALYVGMSVVAAVGTVTLGKKRED